MSETEVKSSVIDNFKALLEKKIATSPGEAVKAEDPFSPKDKVPGFESMTFEAAEVYEVTWQMIHTLLDAKRDYFEATLVPTSIGLAVVRGFSRREWAEIQKELISESESRAKSHAEIKSNQDWVRRDIELHSEESIALRGTMIPKYDKKSIRDIPAGVATVLANAAVAACGFETKNTLPPLKL